MNSTTNWFSTQKNSESGWKLDVISLLAVIGESSVESHLQVLTSSWYCILPRLIPAPQALLKPTRPLRLPDANAAVVGVHNGTLVPSLNYFPEIFHPIESLPPFSFQVFEITHNPNRQQNQTLDTDQEVQASDDSQQSICIGADPATNRGGFVHPSRQSTLSNLKRMLKREKDRPCIPSRKTSPLNIVTIVSFFWTCGLVVWASVIGDGTAILALASISLVSSLVGLASYWKPVLMKRPSKIKVPAGDVVIRTREGAFIVVKCNEEVARELYTGTEECDYYITNEVYRILVGIGTVLLMISVVLLGNCRFTMQAAIGLSYMVLNGIFWAASLLNRRKFWDLSYYNIKPITPPTSRNADHVMNKGVGPEDMPSYTRTLWYAIRETKEVDWVGRGGAAPRTPEWDEWVRLAGENARMGNLDWPAVRMRDRLVGNGAVQNSPLAEETSRRRPPAFEVPPKTNT